MFAKIIENKQLKIETIGKILGFISATVFM